MNFVMVGAPQTIDQNKIFNNFTKYYEELALPEDNESMYRYVRAVMQKAYTSAMSKEYGVVHINVPIRDPLTPDLSKLNFTVGRGKNKFEYSKGENKITLDDSIFKNKNGIIICGGDAYSNYHQEVLELGERLKAPILADPISNFRNYSKDIIIDSYDAFLKNDDIKKELEPEFIIHIGKVPISKRLQQFLAMHYEVLYIQVGESFQYCNPSLSTSRYLVTSPKLFAESICIENSNRDYLEKWLNYQKQMRKQLNVAKVEENLFEGKTNSSVTKFAARKK